MKTVQAADVLLQCATPGNWHGKKKPVKARVVEAFTDISACGQQNSFFSVRNRGQLFGDGTSLFGPHAAFQYYDVLHQASQAGGKFIHLAGAFDYRRAVKTNQRELNATGRFEKHVVLLGKQRLR
jgi:hypothetical protein